MAKKKKEKYEVGKGEAKVAGQKKRQLWNYGRRKVGVGKGISTTTTNERARGVAKKKKKQKNSVTKRGTRLVQ